MAELKTKKNRRSVRKYLEEVTEGQRRKDCFTVMDMMKEVTGCKAKMWGTSIVGFGNYHYKYASGREGDFMIAGFAPRKKALTLYIMSGFKEYDALMKKLGKYRTGKSCLYVNKLADIDLKILRELMTRSVEYMRTTYECTDA